jgi:hypothetical protein
VAKASEVLVQQQAAQRRVSASHPLCPAEVSNRIFAIYEAADLVTVCAWCKRVEIDAEWHLAPRSALAAIEQRYTVSHSICPPCALGPAD